MQDQRLRADAGTFRNADMARDPGIRPDPHPRPDGDERPDGGTRADLCCGVNDAHRMHAGRDGGACIQHPAEARHGQPPARCEDRSLQPQLLPVGPRPQHRHPRPPLGQPARIFRVKRQRQSLGPGRLRLCRTSDRQVKVSGRLGTKGGSNVADRMGHGILLSGATGAPVQI